MGNGAYILCSYVARATKLYEQECKFLVDLHILDIHGPDIILGMAWLESLGKFLADFVGKTLSFSVDGQQRVIHGKPVPPRHISLHSLTLLTSYSTANEFYEIVPVESDAPTATESSDITFPADTPPQIIKVLETFIAVFQLPSGMPPRREFDH